MNEPEEEKRDELADAAPVDFAKDEDVSRGFRRAVREALAAHARRGNKVVVWQNEQPRLDSTQARIRPVIPQNGVEAVGSRPLPPEILILILIVAAIVIAAFTFAITAFIKAGKADAEIRRRRGVPAKDPLAPYLPSDDES